MPTNDRSNDATDRPPATGGFRGWLAQVHARAGMLLLRLDERKGAARLLAKAVRLGTPALEVHFALSAAQWAGGQIDEARATLARALARRPFERRTEPPNAAARILRIQGLEHSHFMLGRRRSGESKIKIRGGNITDRYLTDPHIFAVADFYILGDNLPTCANLPPFDLVLNCISDPDWEAESLAVLKRFLDRHPGVPVINHPDRVMPTTRDGNHQRLKDVPGLYVPPTRRLSRDGLDAAAVIRAIGDGGFSYPVLVRQVGTHTGQTFRKIDAPDGLTDLFAQPPPRDIYLTQYEESLFRERYFRKMRVFFIDGRIHPVVCHIDTAWNVHGGNRTEVMAANDWMMEEERAFLADCRGYLGDAAFRTLEGLYDRIGLDFFGIDFTLMADGRILVYELNPTMRHSFDHAEHFPYLTPHLQRITDSFNEMLRSRVAAAKASPEGRDGRAAGSAPMV